MRRGSVRAVHRPRHSSHSAKGQPGCNAAGSAQHDARGEAQADGERAGVRQLGEERCAGAKRCAEASADDERKGDAHIAFSWLHVHGTLMCWLDQILTAGRRRVASRGGGRSRLRPSPLRCTADTRPADTIRTQTHHALPTPWRRSDCCAVTRALLCHDAARIALRKLIRARTILHRRIARRTTEERGTAECFANVSGECRARRCRSRA